MIGKAISYGAISIINGIATGIGGAVGIDLETEALVKLYNDPGVIKTHIRINGYGYPNVTSANFMTQFTIRQLNDYLEDLFIR